MSENTTTAAPTAPRFKSCYQALGLLVAGFYVGLTLDATRNHESLSGKQFLALDDFRLTVTGFDQSQFIQFQHSHIHKEGTSDVPQAMRLTGTGKPQKSRDVPNSAEAQLNISVLGYTAVVKVEYFLRRKPTTPNQSVVTEVLEVTVSVAELDAERTVTFERSYISNAMPVSPADPPAAATCKPGSFLTGDNVWKSGEAFVGAGGTYEKIGNVISLHFVGTPETNPLLSRLSNTYGGS